MLRVQTVLAGWPGGPGLSTAYFVDATEDAAVAADVAGRVRTFWAAVAASVWSNAMTAIVSSEVDVIDPVTGNLTNTLVIAQPATVTGAFAGAIPLPNGVSAVMTLNTGVFDDGKRIRGRVFITPLLQQAASNGGILDASEQASLVAAGVALKGVQDLEPILSVWRRPRAAGSGVGGALPARAGRTANVTGVTVSTKLSFLRTRRD